MIIITKIKILSARILLTLDEGIDRGYVWHLPPFLPIGLIPLHSYREKCCFSHYRLGICCNVMEDRIIL